MLKTRKSGVPAAALRSTTRLVAPGPEMVKFLLINNSPLVSVIEPVTEKVMTSPGAAPAIAARKEPGPLSAVVVTTAARAGVEEMSMRARRTVKRAMPAPERVEQPE